MGKYTKGPWEINKWGEVITNKIDEYCRKEKLLLTGVSLTAGNHPRQEEAKANAKLISAAPDLLEALKNLANQTVMTEYNADVFKKARQIIAKAEPK